MVERDVAICLRKTDYSDTSQIVTLFTRAGGKISAIAKGAKRAKSAFDGPIELFSYGPVMYVRKEGGQGLFTLREFSQQAKFAGLRVNLHALNAGLFAAELTEKLTEEGDPHEGLFDNLERFLEDVQVQREQVDVLRRLIVFELGLLREVGLFPVFDRCANSGELYRGKWLEVYFSSDANGILSPDSEGAFVDKMLISPQTAWVLGHLSEIGNAKEGVLHEAERVLVYHFTHLLRRPPKMARYFV